MNNDFFLFNKIKDMIEHEFPTVTVNVTSYDDAIIFSFDNKAVYYSSEFQEFITSINIDLLWEQHIYNVLFIVEEEKKYSQIQFGQSRQMYPLPFGKVQIVHSQKQLINHLITIFV